MQVHTYLCQCDQLETVGPPPGRVGIQVIPHGQGVLHYTR